VGEEEEGGVKGGGGEMGGGGGKCGGVSLHPTSSSYMGGSLWITSPFSTYSDGAWSKAASLHRSPHSLASQTRRFCSGEEKSLKMTPSKA